MIFLITNLGSCVLNIFDFASTKTIEGSQGKMRWQKMHIFCGNSNEYYSIYYEKKLSQNSSKYSR